MSSRAGKIGSLLNRYRNLIAELLPKNGRIDMTFRPVGRHPKDPSTTTFRLYLVAAIGIAFGCVVSPQETII